MLPTLKKATYYLIFIFSILLLVASAGVIIVAFKVYESTQPRSSIYFRICDTGINPTCSDLDWKYTLVVGLLLLVLGFALLRKAILLIKRKSSEE